MVELFPDFKELHGSSPADITAAATEPHASGQALVGLSQSLISDAQRVHGNTEGDIRSISTVPQHGAQVSTALGKVGMVAAACLKKFGTDATTFDTGVHQLNDQISSSGLRDPSQPDAISASTFTIQQNVKNSLRPKYRRLVTQLDGDADDTSRLLAHPGDLKTVRTLIIDGFLPLTEMGSWPGIHLTPAERKQAEQNEFKLLTPDQQVAYVKDHPQLDFDIVPVISPAAAQRLADDVAGDVQDKKITAETARILSALATSPVFADRFYGQVTPDQMGDAIEDLNRQMFGVGNERQNNSGMVEMPQKPDLDLYDKFMNGAGLTLATYSRNCADPSGLADDWYHAITDDSHPANAAALTLLIREGGEQKGGAFDPTFIDRVTQQTYDWEKGHDGDPVWGPKAQEAGVWIRDPDKVSDTGLKDQYGQTTYSIRGGFATDGLANLLGGMGHSSEGAQRFFSDDSGHVDQGKIDYLLGKIDGDDVDARTFSDDRLSDEGDGLGEALEAACIGDGGDKSIGLELSNQVLNRVADLSGHDPTWGHDSGWHLWSGMRDSVGDITAGYAHDVYTTLSDGTGVSGAGHLDISYDDLNKVLGEVGRGDDKSGIQVVATALTIEGNERLGDALSGYEKTAEAQWLHAHPGQQLTPEVISHIKSTAALDVAANTNIRDVVQDNGTVLGRLLAQSVNVDQNDEATQKQRAEIASKAFDVATGFLPGSEILGPEAKDLAKTVFDVSKDTAVGEIKDAIDASGESSSDYTSTTDNAWRGGLNAGLLDTLNHYGYTGDAQHPLPADAFDANGHIKSDYTTEGGTTSEAWHDWLTTNAGHTYGDWSHAMSQSFNDAQNEATEDNGH